MLIKFLPLVATGEEAGAGAISYVLREKDAKGMIRAEVKVLRGDPHLVGEIIDSLPFVHRYSSSVIAFAPEDQPTDKQILEVVDDHIKLSFAGLDPDRFAVCAVLHREDTGGCHVHMVSARVDLKTGLSFNPAPPGHQFEFDQIVQHYNWLYGWARPDDPERARTHSKGHLHYKSAAELKQGMAVEVNPKEVLHDHLIGLVKLGKINSRADVRKFLAEMGEITRENDDTISVKVEGEKRAFRMKGSIYKADFDGKIVEKPDSKPARDLIADVKKAIVARRKFDECYQKRAEFNQLKYRDKTKKKEVLKNENLGKDRQRRDRTFRKPKKLISENRLQGLSGKRLAYHGSEATQGVLSVDVISDRRADNRVRRNGTDDEGGLNENRIGEDVIRALDRAERANRELNQACEGFIRSNEDLAKLTQAGRSLAKAANDSIPRIGKAIVNCTDELSRFKSEINLSEYLANQGYLLDKKKSSTAYAVMRKDDEKLVITRATDDHYVYTDAHNPSDCGSIIDYIQNRRSLNLGQVRKVLRPWIGTDRRPVVETYQPIIVKTEADYPKIAMAWSETEPAVDNPYLLGRKLKPSVIALYSATIRQSKNGTVMFCHFNGSNPVSGYEYKSDNHAGFSSGGRKGLFIARRGKSGNVKKIVITETALDALSYAQIDGCRKDTAYVSTGGNPSEDQLLQLKNLVDRYGFDVVLGHDNDRGGEQQAEAIKAVIGGDRHRPTGKDWNQELQDFTKQNFDSPGPRR